LVRTHDARTLYVLDAKGGGCSSAIIPNRSENMFLEVATFTLWRSIASLVDTADK
jgi:hypothetical protein